MYHGFARSAGFNYWESAGYTFAGSAVLGDRRRDDARRRATTRSRAASAARSSARRCSACRTSCSSTAAACRASGASSRRRRSRRRPASTGSSSATATAPSSRAGARRTTAASARLQRAASAKDAGHVDREFERTRRRSTSRSTTACRARGLQVHAAVRLLHVPGDGVERERLRERADARSAGRQVVRGGPGLPRRLGDLRQLRLHRAADLPGLDHGALARHDRPLVAGDATRRSRAPALLGVGYTAVGTRTARTSDRDYNYGVTPQALLALRLTHSDQAALDVTGREYFVSKVASGTSGGHDNIVRLDAALTGGCTGSTRCRSATSATAATRASRRGADGTAGAQTRSASSTRCSARTASAASTGAERLAAPCGSERRAAPARGAAGGRSARASVSSWRDEDEAPCRAARARSSISVEHAVGGAAVEVAGRLVGEHAGGLADERARDRDALALAARELAPAGARSALRRGRPAASASRARARAPRRAAARRMRSGMATLSSAVNSGSR